MQPGTVCEKRTGLATDAGGLAVLGGSNGDDLKDSVQTAVATAPLLCALTAVSAPGHAMPVYVTLIADSLDGKFDPDANSAQPRLWVQGGL